MKREATTGHGMHQPAKKRCPVRAFVIGACIASAAAMLSVTGVLPVGKPATAAQPNAAGAQAAPVSYTGVPAFKVSARDSSTISLLVPASTTQDQLQRLITAFRQARQAGEFSRLIPATTPGNPFGSYSIVWVLVFTEPEWASSGKLKKFVKAGAYKGRSSEFCNQYTEHVKAEYFYGPQQEYGNLGYGDGWMQSSSYKKLF